MIETIKKTVEQTKNEVPKINDNFNTSKFIDFSRPGKMNSSIKGAKKLDISKSIDYSNEVKQKDIEFYSTYKQRIDKTPKDGPRGHWTGERGESKYIPADIPENRELIDFLQSKAIDGIQYKNGIPDFSTVAAATVIIPDMTDIRSGTRTDGKPNNFGQALNALADRWNKIQKNGRTDWKWQDAEKWSKGLIIHERSDLKTCDFVPRIIHEFYGHLAGVSEYKTKMNIIKDGGFDE